MKRISIVIITIIIIVILVIIFPPFNHTITVQEAVSRKLVEANNKFAGFEGKLKQIHLFPIFPKYLIVEIEKDSTLYPIKVPLSSTSQIAVLLVYKTNFKPEIEAELTKHPKWTELDAINAVAEAHNIKVDLILGSLKSDSIHFAEEKSLKQLKVGNRAGISINLENGDITIFISET